MKDFLLDIAKNSQPLGDVTLAIDTMEEHVEVQGSTADKTLRMVAESVKEIDQLSDKEFVFGVTKLDMLRKLLQYYKGKDSIVSLETKTRKDKKVPVEIKFESPEKSLSRYRLVDENIPNFPEQYEKIEFDFDVTVEKPSRVMISEFAELYGIYKNVSDSFQIKVVEGDLYLVIGEEDRADHGAMFKFAENVGDADIKSGYNWNPELFINVMKLGDGASCSVSFSTELIQVNINTGICSYIFYLTGSF